ncbi:2-C-methyl-D-erythritol 2,4-cyclodiphosphate synthase [Clostridium algidicarnis]|uniref:2-C-methyl-D-erythritol 2,4-cyclodiphosphate synthase n=1 Tax=Clostridium algidicarnis TaxID=37659 RepID=UPI0016245BCC|nr:2-C-methyl-D-erythritol 2,4-cyclodiphosphate synthase [Clostridium algidicarnis]MBB6697230.1 2-C-methyl-D-erythritol 2,4-cyclodiphosphate synthase [Clostridium algidicarnis]MBU3194364.1 2-C-methyl-D-erythritol 2,4-cyclodiphosphate synthase [Clostridium algidicarnis]MBU3204501.1 2-C-methyl-D-erythritol 2,4-cyclodiphosphate synthase [Clostridium algidicarnis]MBU3206372.1 2-C-methyl-D-erythritol 2,4-cyclodiphosphate synthase [Clostridium algidicarnis]MBU3212416.1 2-C-methyl-D-erythritol 2,4-cy
MRIGLGYDVHKLVEDRSLILGGVTIPHKYGLLGHSDADVLVHAIMDSILGAASLGDIGTHFPDNNLIYKDISSLSLLKKVYDLILKKGFCIGNIDATIIAEAPKLSPYIDEMRINISSILGIDINQINIKATTEEGLGFTGSREGISSQSICLLISNT